MENPVTHFQILSKVPEETAQFYVRLFGWTVSATNPLGYRQIDTRSSIGIQGGIWPTPPAGSSFAQLFVTVDDVKATVKKAEGLGAKVAVAPTTLPDGDEMAVLVDPQQLSFGVWKPRRQY